MQSNSLIRKTILYFIGNFSSRIFSVLLIPIYAFYVMPDDLGTYDLLVTILNVTTPIILAAIWEAVLKFLLSTNDEHEYSKLISTTFIFSLLMIFFYLTILLILKSANLFSNINYVALFFMTISYGVSTIYQYFSRGFAENKLFVLSSVVSTFIRFISVVIFVILLNWGFYGLVISYISGTISSIIIIENKLNLLRKIKLSLFDKNLLKSILRFSVPLIFNLISAWFISGFGRIIINSEIGSEMNGQYSFAANFSQVFIAIGSVITMALIEEAILSIQSDQNNTDLNKSINTITDLLFSLAIFSIPFVIIVYNFFADTEYSTSIYLVFPLILYAVINTSASNVGSLFQASGNTRHLFSTTMLGGLTTIIFSISLLNYIGVFAVIVGQLLGTLVMLISRLILINKFLTFNFNYKNFILHSFTFSILSITMLNFSIEMVVLISICMMGIYIYIYIDTIKRIVKKLRERKND